MNVSGVYYARDLPVMSVNCDEKAETENSQCMCSQKLIIFCIKNLGNRIKKTASIQLCP